MLLTDTDVLTLHNLADDSNPKYVTQESEPPRIQLFPAFLLLLVKITDAAIERLQIDVCEQGTHLMKACQFIWQYKKFLKFQNVCKN